MLARHYQEHFASLLPGSSSERLTVLAWWLSDQVEMVMPLGQELADKLSGSIVEPRVHWSAIGAALAHPRLEASNFAYATRYTGSPWSLALQCQLDKDAAIAIGEETQRSYFAPNQPAQSQAADSEASSIDPVTGAFAASVIGMFPRAAKDRDNCVYGFDRTVREAAEQWERSMPNGRSRELLNAFLSASSEAGEPSRFLVELKRIGEAKHADQILILGILRVLALGATAPVEDVWALLTDQAWRQQVLQGLEPSGPELLFESLSEIVVTKNEKWRSNVPHLYALACEAATDAERKRLLFAYTLLSCIASDTDSALRRLLTSRNRRDYAAEVDFWREQLHRALPNVVPWVVGKIRPVLSALRVR